MSEHTKTVHLVMIQPGPSLDAHIALVQWPKTRGVPCPHDMKGAWTRTLAADGMLCEIDDDDMEEARTMGEVNVIGTREVKL